MADPKSKQKKAEELHKERHVPLKRRDRPEEYGVADPKSKQKKAEELSIPGEACPIKEKRSA